MVNITKEVYQVHKQLFCTQGGHISCTLYISAMPCLLNFIHSNSVLKFKSLYFTHSCCIDHSYEMKNSDLKQSRSDSNYILKN